MRRTSASTGQSLAWILAAVLLESACGQRPVRMPPQVQQPPATGHSFAAADPNAAGQIIDGIGPLEGAGYRWTSQRATVKLALASTKGLSLSARFWIADAAFQKTGPVEIAFSVNGHELARRKYDKPGEQTFAAPVPADWLRAGDNEASLMVDPTYDVNGVALGVPLAELGFTD